MLLRIHSHTDNGQTADGASTRLTKLLHIPILHILGLTIPNPHRLIHDPLLLHDQLPNIHRSQPIPLHILHANHNKLPKIPPIHCTIPPIHAKRRFQLRIPRVPFLHPPLLTHHPQTHQNHNLHPLDPLVHIHYLAQPIANPQPHK